MNTVAIIGTIGQEPDIKYFESGSVITSFSICVNKWNKKEEKEVPHWFKCKAFGKTAEMVGQYFKKGNRIGVEGELATDTWEKEGKKHSLTYIVVNSVTFIDKKEKPEDTDKPLTNAEDVDVEIDNCPF